MNQKLYIYDTTLRDGNQALGINLSLTDKLDIASRLSDLGIHYIEGGWPNPTNDVDIEFYKRASRLKLRAKLAVFGSTRRPRVTCASDPFVQALVKSEAPVATVFGKTWDLHVKKGPQGLARGEPGAHPRYGVVSCETERRGDLRRGALLRRLQAQPCLCACRRLRRLKTPALR